ncbi:MAG: SIMPL domain-containing protein [Pseudomonadota bacterium]
MNFIRCSVLTVLLACSPLFADDAVVPQISVTGTAEKLVKPDLLHWNLRVEHRGTDLSEVAFTHNQAVANLIDLLEDAGVDKDDMQTSRMQFGENWEYKNNSRVRVGYNASTSVVFELKSIDDYAKMWLRFASLPGVSVTNVSFDHSKRKKLYKQARIDALVAARSKAEDMAAALDTAIGDPLRIEEETQPNYSVTANARLRADSEGIAGGSGGIAAGLITIQARVRVTFVLKHSGR